MRLRDRLRDGAAHRLGGQEVRHALAHLRGDADAFAPRILHGERDDAPLAEHLELSLHRPLDVLRVEVLAVDDDRVAGAAGHVELPSADEAQIARAEVGAITRRTNARAVASGFR